MGFPIEDGGGRVYYPQSYPPSTQDSTPPQPKYYDVDAGRQNHETRRTEMQDIRGKLANVDDNSSDYLKLLDRYQQLEREEEAAQLEVKKALDEGPDPNLNSQGQATYGANLKKLDEDITATVNGDDDGDGDGMHNLGKGRYLTSIQGDGDSMLGTSNRMLGQYGDDARTLYLNRNSYDPNSADSNFNSKRAPGTRDADLVHKGDLVVIGTKIGAAAPDKPELPISVTDAAKQSKAQHQDPNAAQYAAGLDNMLQSPQFANADKNKQLKLVHDYDTTFTNAEKKGKPLTENQQAQLGKLLTSPGYYDVNDTVKNKVLELFVDTAGKSPEKVESLIKLVNNQSFMKLNDESKEKQILDGFIKGPQNPSGKTHSNGNFFQRHVMPLVGKAKDTAIDGASAAWNKAAPVINTVVDKATPLAHAAWEEASPVLKKTVDVATPVVEATWDKASPIVNAAWDKASPSLYAARDQVKDGIATTWNHIPGHETVEKKIDHWTDNLPFNNAVKASVKAFFGAKKITLDKDETAEIQRDPSFKKADEEMSAEAKAAARKDLRYGKEAFDIDLSNHSLELGGNSGDMDKKQQLFHIYDLSNPDIRQTWGVAGNEQTWLLRHCQLTGTAHVAKDGSITIDYTVKDKLDLSAHGKVDTTYDVVSEKLGSVWHGLLGAEMPQLTGKFTKTVA